MEDNNKPNTPENSTATPETVTAAPTTEHTEKKTDTPTIADQIAPTTETPNEAAASAGEAKNLMTLTVKTPKEKETVSIPETADVKQVTIKITFAKLPMWLI